MKHRTARSSAAAGFGGGLRRRPVGGDRSPADRRRLPRLRPRAAPAGTPAPHDSGAPASTELPKCGDCHTEVEALRRNPHARVRHGEKKPDPNDVCSTCHGDGTKHMEAGGTPR